MSIGRLNEGADVEPAPACILEYRFDATANRSDVTKTAQFVSRVLARLKGEAWRELLTASAAQDRWQRGEWWHNKYYRDNAAKDGNVLQQPKKGEPEAPYKRELFHPSPASRFSLGEHGGVAYLSKDLGANFCETIEQFSGKPRLSFKELSSYLDGEGNPTPGWFGYPSNFHVVAGTLILDVSMCNTPFFETVSHWVGDGPRKKLWQVFTSRDDEDKLSTQLVARDARRNGFDGIVYASVRTPVDVVMPNWNLVMFSPEKLRRGVPSAVR